MRFEQAFYTRGTGLLNEKGTGLGIAAASRTDTHFLDKCMNIGGKFNTEHTKEQAEFVLYSDRLESFVGVSVNPASNLDGGVVNKLCHIFIPLEKDCTADEYYQEYQFEKKVEKRSELDIVEFTPYLSVGKFTDILEKYEFDQEKLAYFLYKLYPVLFQEKNFLLIVIDDSKYQKEKFSELAREITWLANYLIPAIEDTLQYRKNLSYGVNTTENLSIVNLAFVTDEKLHSNRFYLGQPGSEEVPEVYYKLSEMAIKSYQNFLDFLQQLQDVQIEKNDSSINIQLNYIQWKLKQGFKIQEKELPLRLDSLRQAAIRNKNYCCFLYGCLIALDDVAISELIKIWQYIIGPTLEEKQVQVMDNFIPAVEKVIFLMYGKSQKHYKILLQHLPVNFRKQIMEDLYFSENSCIYQHIESISASEECRQMFELYEDLNESLDFISQIKEKAEKYYFEMNKENREFFTSVFKGMELISWNNYILGRINEVFSTDSYEDFMEKELGAIEMRHIPLYFANFLDKCVELSDEKIRKRLKDIAEKYLEEYSDAIPKEQEKRYEMIKNNWKEEYFYNKIKTSTLQEISELNLKNLSEELIEEWIKAVNCRLSTETLTENILKSLICNLEFLRSNRKPNFELFIKKIWDACGLNYLNRAIFSNTFGKEEFSIWMIVDPCEIEQYEKLYHLFDKYPEYKNLEIYKLRNQCLEFNRLSYILWKDTIKQNSSNLKIWEGCSLIQFREEAIAFIEKIEDILLERADRNDGINYLKLELKKEEKWSEYKITMVERCGRWEYILNRYPKFYESLLEETKNFVKEIPDKRIRELNVYYELSIREKVTEENVDVFAGIIHEARKVLGDKVKNVKKLEEEYHSVMNTLKTEYEEIKKTIQQDKYKKIDVNNKIAQKEKELSDLKKEIQRLESNINNKNIRKEELQNKIRNVEKIEKEGGRSVRNKESFKTDKELVAQSDFQKQTARDGFDFGGKSGTMADSITEISNGVKVTETDGCSSIIQSCNNIIQTEIGLQTVDREYLSADEKTKAVDIKKQDTKEVGYHRYDSDDYY